MHREGGHFARSQLEGHVNNIRQVVKGLGVGGAALALIAGGALLAGGAAIAADTIGSGDIKNNSIRQHDIADGAVGSGEIINNSIRRHDVADGSVGPGEILDGSVRANDLDPTVVESLKGEKGDKGDPGEQGEPGAPGAAGADGADGVSGLEQDGFYKSVAPTPAGEYTVVTAECAEDKYAVGGGFSPEDGFAFDGVTVIASRPSVAEGNYTVIEGDPEGSVRSTAWELWVTNTADTARNIRPWVSCVTIGE
jgi:hypothetical protein